VDWILAILLFLHVLGAIVAFGPSFAFALMGPMAAAEPMHMNYTLRLQKKIASTLITPLALVQGVTGLLIVWRISAVSGVGFVDVLTQGWLLVAIVLYITALTISFALIYPNLRILLHGTSGPPPAPPAGGAPAGPPPHIMAAAKRIRMASMSTLVLIVSIVFLMVTKPF
jgi:uncharacterized membrane protein